MSDVEIRAITADEFAEFYFTAELPYAEDLDDEDVAVARELVPLERTLAAFEGDRIVATAASYAFDVSVPGGTAPMAAVTAVAVLPTHRRRGLVSGVLRRQLSDLHERGEALACLWASEAPIYWRFGYGAASYAASLSIDRPHTAFRRPPPASGVRFVDVEEALASFPAVYERARRVRPGMPARTEPWWRTWLGHDSERQRRGQSRRFLVAIDGGYLVYRLKEGWDGWVPDNHLEVEELVADHPDGEAALWRFCFDMDLVAKVTADRRPVDDVLPHLLADPRRLRRVEHDALWVRLVRLDEALAARTYAREATVVLHVTDATCPWNAGTWQADLAPAGAVVRRSDRAPHVSLDIAELGAIYLGGQRLSQLHRAGRVVEHAAGAVAAVDAAFGADPLPWCPFVF